MQKFTNPLDKIKIASPCGADWNEMRGDKRRRYCTLCKLNVYNLSDMSKTEAESFLINSEGRVCLRVFRRADGSVITKDCPVGWQKLKRKVSRTAAAVFSLIAGFFGGVLALESLQSLRRFTNYDKVPEPFFESKDDRVSFGITDGILENLPQIKIEILKNREF
jgi:hypothetical protein